MCSRQKREISKMLVSQSCLCYWLKVIYTCKKACVYTTVRPNFGATDADQYVSTGTRLFSRVFRSCERKERKEENNAIIEKSRVRSFALITLRCIHELMKKRKKRKKIGGKMLIAESGHGEPDSPSGRSYSVEEAWKT